MAEIRSLHSVETTALVYPLMCNVDGWRIVRNQNEAWLSSLLEVHRIRSLLGKDIDSSNNVPSGPPERLYKSSQTSSSV